MSNLKEKLIAIVYIIIMGAVTLFTLTLPVDVTQLDIDRGSYSRSR